MDITGLVSYIISAFSVLAGIAIFFGDEEYIVPASGRSRRLPCSFLFWVVALIFWAMAVKVEDDDSII